MTQENSPLWPYDDFMLRVFIRNTQLSNLEWGDISHQRIIKQDQHITLLARRLSDILTDIQVEWDYSPELVRRWLLFYKKHPMVRMLQERVIRCLLSR